MSIERIKLFMVRDYRYKTKPYEHQYVALEKSWDKEEYAYFMEMGTGKSKVLIDNIAMLYDRGKINAAMIIAPKGVYRNWLSSEIPTHLPSHIQYKSVLWTALTSKTKDKEYQSLFETDYNLHIFIMNVEALSTPKGMTFARKFLSCHNTLIAVDESTTIKTPKAARTRNIISIANLAKYRRILTGSPITKSPLDLYTQCKFLNEHLLGFSSYYSFQNRYACMVDKWFGGRKVSVIKSYQRLDELSKSIEPFSYRVLKEDCLDLPDKIYIKREIELTKEQVKLYQSMKLVAMAALSGKVVKAPHVLTQLMRLHQITCGHFKSDDGQTQKIASNRLDELMDVLSEMEGKAVIWAHYRYDIEVIVEAIKKEYGDNSVVTYYGDTSTDDRQKAIKLIQDPNSPVRFIVGTPQTGGYGITLTGASTMIYYSNGYDLEKRQQSEARIDRIGQEKPMTYIDIIAEGTVDEKIVKALRTKVDIATQIMGEELKEWI